MRRFLLAVVVAAALAGCATAGSGADVVRIDATSAETAEASYQAMMVGRSETEQQRLALAVLMLNLQGVKSAYDVVGTDEGSVVPIRDKVAGLSADEIIALATRVKSPRVNAAPAGR